MLNRVSGWVAGLLRPAPHFDAGDYRVAVAALLAHAVGVDGDVAPAETRRLAGLLRERFDLDERTAAALIAVGTARARESVDLTDFTQPLRRVLAPAQRATVIDLLWDVVLVDGSVRELEESFVDRVGDLLGVAAAERLAARPAR